MHPTATGIILENPCPTCKGTGVVSTSEVPPRIRKGLRKNMESCRKCKGVGALLYAGYEKRHEDDFFGGNACPDCNGQGELQIEQKGELTYYCPTCDGTGGLDIPF